MDGLTQVPVPRNEPVLGYGPGSAEREMLLSALAEMAGAPVDLPMTIVIVNNGGYAALSEFTPHFNVKEPLGTQRPGIDVVGLARAMRWAARASTLATSAVMRLECASLTSRIEPSPSP